jgi:hypothetical protein
MLLEGTEGQQVLYCCICRAMLCLLDCYGQVCGSLRLIEYDVRDLTRMSEELFVVVSGHGVQQGLSSGLTDRLSSLLQFGFE